MIARTNRARPSICRRPLRAGRPTNLCAEEVLLPGRWPTASADPYRAPPHYCTLALCPTAPMHHRTIPLAHFRARIGRALPATPFAGPGAEGRRAWKQPVGAGYASFVVADGRAFTIEQRRNQEVAAAYDVQTGREIWTNAWNGSFEESMGGDGPRATPTYHEGRIYALGAEGEMRVLDAAKGTLVWRRNILSDNGASNPSWGMSASPLIVDKLRAHSFHITGLHVHDYRSGRDRKQARSRYGAKRR